MLFANHLVILRGGGDLATGAAYHLHNAGFPLIVLELARPLVVRHRVALATAVWEDHITIEDLHGQLVPSVADAVALAATGTIPVLVAPELEPVLAALPQKTSTLNLAALVDARIAKRNLDTRINQAPLVIGMGPGFSAGVDCHAAIETMRGHMLGRILWEGSPVPNTGTPGLVAGKGKERVLRAPSAGTVSWHVRIGDSVIEGTALGSVAGFPVTAPFDGVIRGLIFNGISVRAGMKIGDVDARGEVAHCFTISDKSLALGGAVLSAILTFLNRQNLTS